MYYVTNEDLKDSLTIGSGDYDTKIHNAVSYLMAISTLSDVKAKELVLKFLENNEDEAYEFGMDSFNIDAGGYVTEKEEDKK